MQPLRTEKRTSLRTLIQPSSVTFVNLFDDSDFALANTGTNLEKQLKDAGINTIVLVGLTTDHCVSTTTRMGGNLGFRVFVISDATATFDRVGPGGKKHDFHRPCTHNSLPHSLPPFSPNALHRSQSLSLPNIGSVRKSFTKSRWPVFIMSLLQ